MQEKMGYSQRSTGHLETQTPVKLWTKGRNQPQHSTGQYDLEKSSGAEKWAFRVLETEKALSRGESNEHEVSTEQTSKGKSL